MKRKLKFTIILSTILVTSLLLVNNINHKKEVQNSTLNNKSHIAVMVGDTVQANFPKKGEGTFESITCDNGSTGTWDDEAWTLNLSSVTSDNCVVKFKELTASLKVLQHLDLTVNTGTPDFSQVATTNEGVFEGEDDYGKTYYFRGNVDNNYVKFGGFYWRIVRINGDGTLRLIYDGTAAHANNKSSTDRFINNGANVAFNSNYDDNAYVGYMYGKTGSSTYEATHANTNSSTIKTTIDTWYQNNLGNQEGISEALSGDTMFCNDRSKTSGTGIGITDTDYGAYNRLVRNRSPQFTCTNLNDQFTTKDAKAGNKALTYPIGLLMADEVSYAGGVLGTNNSGFYLYKGQNYWLGSPYSFDYGNANEFNVLYSGFLDYNGVSNTLAVAPVINLKTDYCLQLKGNGTRENPFEKMP